MSFTVFEANVREHVQAIRLCLDSHLRMAALSLIYCGIDIVAAIGRPKGKPKSDRTDFRRFAEDNMKCKTRLGLTGMDLYAARCGILHTYTADSTLSDNKEARRIFYAWGNQTPDMPMGVLKRAGRSEIFIQLEELFAAYLDGVAAFSFDAAQNSELANLVEKRAGRMFSNYASLTPTGGTGLNSRGREPNA